MRVLAVGNSYPPAGGGGYERIFASTVDTLRRRGHDVEVLTTAPGPGAELPGKVPAEADIHRELRWWWCDHRFPKRSWRERICVERHNAAVLRGHLARRPDVVCWLGMGGMSLSLIEQVRTRGLPAVGIVADPWMVYGFEVDRWLRGARRLGPLARLIERRAGVPSTVDLGSAGRWLFTSAFLMERAPPLQRAEIVRAGVDLRRFREEPAREWAWRLACVGRVEPRKGVAYAIEALAHLPGEATLTVDGPASPAHLAELKRLVAEVGAAERVDFLVSPTGDIRETYAAADAVLFPVTWAEPWGLVPLEAMAVGRPVVATATGGAAEYLTDDTNALVVPQRDPLAIAAAVRRLEADRGLRERLRQGGLETARRYPQDAFEAAVATALEEEAARR